MCFSEASGKGRSKQAMAKSCVWSCGGQLLWTGVMARQEFHYLKALHITTSHLCAFYPSTLSFQIIESVFKPQVSSKSFVFSPFRCLFCVRRVMIYWVGDLRPHSDIHDNSQKYNRGNRLPVKNTHHFVSINTLQFHLDF